MATLHDTPDAYKDEKDVYGSSDVVQVGDDTVVEGAVAEIRSAFTYEDANRLKRKADIRVLILLCLCYLVKNIDANIATYVVTLNKGKPSYFYTMVGISADNYSYASTVYTACFVLAELPSNLTIKWATPRIHISRIVLLWGITCACTAAAKNTGSFFACRALLGLFEGGLWPGILYQLTCWYRPDELAVRATFLITLAQFANIIVACLAYGLAFADGKGGLTSWQWGYVITGLIAVVLSIAVFFLLPDWPDSPPSFRQFLTPEEGKFMVARLPPGASRSTDINFDWEAIKKDAKGGLAWSFGLMQMFLTVATSGLTFWLPTIVSEFGLTGTKVSGSTLLLIPMSVLYIVVSVGFGAYLDRQTKIPRPLFMLISTVFMIAIFIGLCLCKSAAGLYTLILLFYIPYAIEQTCFVPLRSMSTKGSSSAAFGYALYNVMGNSPGLYSAQIWRSKYAPRYTVPFVVCIVFFVCLFASICWMWYLCYDLEKEVRRVAGERRKLGKQTGEIAEVEIHDVRAD